MHGQKNIKLVNIKLSAWSNITDEKHDIAIMGNEGGRV